MASLPNARRIWKHSRGLSRLKLLLAQGAVTHRPQIRAISHLLLTSLSRDGLVWVGADIGFGPIRAGLRLNDLQFDLQGFKEVVIENCYELPQDWTPDVIIDGGGNIGIFTLTALKRWPQAKVIIFEPVPANLECIKTNLKVNNLHADVINVCLGDTEGDVSFYERQANQGSFSDDLPYDTVSTVKVTSLLPYLPKKPEVKCLIKLDIEGAEHQVIPNIIREISSNTFVLGELHDRQNYEVAIQDSVRQAGRSIRYFANEDTCAMFHIPPSSSGASSPS